MRTKSISIKSIRLYKVVLVLLLTAYLVFYTNSILRHLGAGTIITLSLDGLVVVAIVYYWKARFLKHFSMLKDLSYDDENLYIVENEIEEQIPFYEIRDVDIVNAGGVYQFNFWNKQLHQGAVRCKTSMWYPLNYKKVDKELNRVRALIRKANINYREKLGDDKSLMSFN